MWLESFCLLSLETKKKKEEIKERRAVLTNYIWLLLTEDYVITRLQIRLGEVIVKR